MYFWSSYIEKPPKIQAMFVERTNAWWQHIVEQLQAVVAGGVLMPDAS